MENKDDKKQMTTQEKREALAGHNVLCWVDNAIHEVALNGCEGYNNMTDDEINELYDDIFRG